MPEPRIYVASLSDYNAGRLHGAWIDCSSDIDAMQAEINAMLKASRDPFAEEAAIHDWEGLKALDLGECLELDKIARYCALLESSDLEAEVIEAALDTFGADYVLEADDPAEFIRERYLGTFEDLGDWAAEYLEGSPGLNSLPDDLRGYFDFEAYARDQVLSGYLTATDTPSGIVLFRNT